MPFSNVNIFFCARTYSTAINEAFFERVCNRYLTQFRRVEDTFGQSPYITMSKGKNEIFVKRWCQYYLLLHVFAIPFEKLVA